MDTWRHLTYSLPAAKHFKPIEEYVSENRTTRRTGKGFLAVPFQRSESGETRFIQQGARIWNDAPQEIRMETDEAKAKRLIHEYCKTLPL